MQEEDVPTSAGLSSFNLLDERKEAMIQKTLTEVRRVMKPEGALAVVEFHKVDGPPGPPQAWRLTPSELEELLAPFGLRCSTCVDVGPSNYLSLFTLHA